MFNRYIEDTSSAEDLHMLAAEGLRRKLSHSFVADMFRQIGDKTQVSHQSRSEDIGPRSDVGISVSNEHVTRVQPLVL